MAKLRKTGERQVVTEPKQAARDHRNRYHWVAEDVASRVSITDVGFGCGYGSAILADAGLLVTAYDNDQDAFDHAVTHFGDRLVDFRFGDAQTHPARFLWGTATVAFEIIEHLYDPKPLLTAIRSPTLYASVPDELGNPWSSEKFPFHYRHYTVEQFHKLLQDTGWRIVGDWHQRDKSPGKVMAGVNPTGSRTLLVKAERV